MLFCIYSVLVFCFFESVLHSHPDVAQVGFKSQEITAFQSIKSYCRKYSFNKASKEGFDTFDSVNMQNAVSTIICLVRTRLRVGFFSLF